MTTQHRPMYSYVRLVIPAKQSVEHACEPTRQDLKIPAWERTLVRPSSLLPRYEVQYHERIGCSRYRKNTCIQPKVRSKPRSVTISLTGRRLTCRLYGDSKPQIKTRRLMLRGVSPDLPLLGITRLAGKKRAPRRRFPFFLSGGLLLFSGFLPIHVHFPIRLG